MKEIDEDNFSSEIFDKTEDSIYKVLEKFSKLQNVDQSLTYIYI